MKNNKWLACNYQMKSTLDSFLEKEEADADIHKAHVQTYQSMEHQQISTKMFSGELLEYISGFPTIRNKPSADPLSYSQDVVDCVLQLSMKYSLSLPEIVSLQLAYKRMSHTTYFYAATTDILLSLEKRLPLWVRGYQFGFFFSRLQENWKWIIVGMNLIVILPSANNIQLRQQNGMNYVIEHWYFAWPSGLYMERQ